jgi:hypothetical protein
MQLDVRHATLPQLVAGLEQFTIEIQRQLGGLSTAQLNWKPNPKEWSLGQCIEHLILTSTTYFPQIEALLAGTKTKTFWERLPLAPKLFAANLIFVLEPKRKLAVPTAGVFTPTMSAVDPQILQLFAARQARLRELMQASAHFNLERTIITSPAATFVTYSLLDAFRIIVIHGQHHYAHTARIMALPQFPRG